jgi:ankyrin repeat protein
LLAKTSRRRSCERGRYAALVAGGLDSSGSAHPDVNARDKFGETPLLAAVRDGELAVVERLLAVPGVDVNARDGIGRTALSIAAFHGASEITSRLLAREDVTPNLVDRDRQTPLHWAVMGGHEPALAALLADPRANPGIRNSAGMTALDLALERHDAALVAPLEARVGHDPGRDELDPGDSVPDIRVELPLRKHPAIAEPPRRGTGR